MSKLRASGRATPLMVILIAILGVVSAVAVTLGVGNDDQANAQENPSTTSTAAAECKFGDELDSIEENISKASDIVATAKPKFADADEVVVEAQDMLEKLVKAVKDPSNAVKNQFDQLSTLLERAHKANEDENADDAKDNLSKAETALGKLRLELDCGPPDDGEATVEESDGERRIVPVVGHSGNGESTDADTAAFSDPRTPAVYEDAKAKGPLQNWGDLVRIMGNMQWYVDGINARESKTGFNWSDIEAWAKIDDVEFRIIQAYNSPLSDEEIRNKLRHLVKDRPIEELQIIRYNTCLMNTRGFGRGVMQDFVDCRVMERVSLAVPIFGKDDVVEGLSDAAGVFVDCFNVHWFAKHVEVPPGILPPPPSTTVPPTTTPSVPPTTPSSVPRSSTTTTTTPTEEGKDHTRSPIVSDPNHRDERLRPNVDCPYGQVANREGKCVSSTTTTTAAPTTSSTSSSTTATTWEPEPDPEPDSGDGFTSTTQAPPTTQPPTTTPPSGEDHGGTVCGKSC